MVSLRLSITNIHRYSELSLSNSRYQGKALIQACAHQRVPVGLSPIRTEPHLGGDYFRIDGNTTGTQKSVTLAAKNHDEHIGDFGST